MTPQDPTPQPSGNGLADGLEDEQHPTVASGQSDSLSTAQEYQGRVEQPRATEPPTWQLAVEAESSDTQASTSKSLGDEQRRGVTASENGTRRNEEFEPVELISWNTLAEHRTSISQDAAVQASDDAAHVQERVVELQRVVLENQGKLEYNRQTLQDGFVNLKEVIADLSQLATHEDNEAVDKSRLKELCSKFLDYSRVFESQAEQVKRLENETGRGVWDLVNLLPRLLEVLGIPTHVKRSSPRKMDTSHSVHSSRSSPNVGPARQEFYEARGLVRQLQDLLENNLATTNVLDEEYVMVQRPEIPGDPAFGYEWQSHRSRLRENLANASAKLSRLWENLRAENLEVESVTFDISRTAVLLDQNAELEQTDAAANKYSVQGAFSSMPNLLSNLTVPTNARIENWIDDVPPDPLNPDVAPVVFGPSPPDREMLPGHPKSDPGCTQAEAGTGDVQDGDTVNMKRADKTDPVDADPGLLRRMLRRALHPLGSRPSGVGERRRHSFPGRRRSANT